jgi:glucosylceramidase
MAKQTWESCIYTAEDERDFIKNYLGPTLASNGLGSKNLICWDHNRDLIYQRASTILSDADAAKYIWGIGFHWYETWTGSAMQFEQPAPCLQNHSLQKISYLPKAALNHLKQNE